MQGAAERIVALCDKTLDNEGNEIPMVGSINSRLLAAPPSTYSSKL
jgi:hypothetical protein